MSPSSQPRACFPITILSCALLFFTGCGKEKPEVKPDADASAAQNSTMNATTSVVAAKSTDSKSPAAAGNQLPGPNSTPEEVCERFMKLLQSGNRIGAENLFTKTALTVTGQAGLKLEPMGGPTSTYRIGEARYATTRRKLAQVDCFITDKDENGKIEEMEVTWQLHRLNEGFRISGVMLQLGEGDTKDLLSLENTFDVSKLQSLAGADVLDEPESRQAKSETTNLK